MSWPLDLRRACLGAKETSLTPSLTSWPTRKALGGWPPTAIKALPCPVVEAITPTSWYCTLLGVGTCGKLVAWPKALATVGMDRLGAMGALAKPTTGNAAGAVNSNPQYITPPAAVAQVNAASALGHPNRFMVITLDIKVDGL